VFSFAVGLEAINFFLPPLFRFLRRRRVVLSFFPGKRVFLFSRVRTILILFSLPFSVLPVAFFFFPAQELLPGAFLLLQVVFCAEKLLRPFFSPLL